MHGAAHSLAPWLRCAAALGRAGYSQTPGHATQLLRGTHLPARALARAHLVAGMIRAAEQESRRSLCSNVQKLWCGGGFMLTIVCNAARWTEHVRSGRSIPVKRASKPYYRGSSYHGSPVSAAKPLAHVVSTVRYPAVQLAPVSDCCADAQQIQSWRAGWASPAQWRCKACARSMAA